MNARVLFYVQSLLGVGHLKRAALIARALAAAGMDVTVVLGGQPVNGISFAGCARVLLPPIRARDARFSILVDAEGEPIDDAFRDRRMTRLVQEFEAIQPGVVLIELFPFGRRQFAFELLPLLEAAWARPVRPRVICSLRDVLVLKNDIKRNQEVIARAKQFFDRVLVHGDPAVLPLEASFPQACALADRLTYTGYVAERPAPSTPGEEGENSGEVIVTVGGGAVGEPLLRAALAARPMSRAGRCVWRLLTGPNLADRTYDDLRWNCPDGVVVERWRSDLPALLQNAALSISQAGYNTMMDVVAAGVPAVVVPFADAGETEQTQRAQVLADRGLVSLLPAHRLSPEVLAAVIDEALTKPRRTMPLDTNGAETTAQLIASFCAGMKP